MLNIYMLHLRSLVLQLQIVSSNSLFITIINYEITEDYYYDVYNEVVTNSFSMDISERGTNLSLLQVNKTFTTTSPISVHQKIK